MSAVQGSIRESGEFIKETGFFEAQVVCINPDRERLEKLLGTQLERDPEYLGEDDKGKTKLNIVVWLKDVKTGKFKNVRFFLKDVFRENTIKEGETKPKKKQYINTIGATQWAEKEADLLDWFKEREYRQAHEGEEELYNFVVNWLSKLNFKDARAVLSFDWNKLMRGNVKEIAEQIGSQYEDDENNRAVVCLSTVRSVTKDGETKEYEQVYNKAFLPAYMMKQIRLKKIDQAFIDVAKATERKKRTKLQKFVLDVTDRQYGVKDYYTLGELEKYDPAKNPVSGDKSHIQEDDTSY
jgi:hypothetical protein